VGHVVCIEETRGVYRVLAGKPERRRLLGRSRNRWEDNIKVDDLLHLSVVYMPLCMLACVLFCATNKSYLVHLNVYIYIYIHTHTNATTCVSVCVCVCVCSHTGERRRVYRVLVGKPEGK